MSGVNFNIRVINLIGRNILGPSFGRSGRNSGLTIDLPVGRIAGELITFPLIFYRCERVLT